jgi:hypothetical protein
LALFRFFELCEALDNEVHVKRLRSASCRIHLSSRNREFANGEQWQTGLHRGEKSRYGAHISRSFSTNTNAPDGSAIGCVNFWNSLERAQSESTGCGCLPDD